MLPQAVHGHGVEDDLAAPPRKVRKRLSDTLPALTRNDFRTQRSD